MCKDTFIFSKDMKNSKFCLNLCLINPFYMITYQTIDVKRPDIKKRECSAWIKSVASGHGKKVGEIAYIFCDDDKILEVNNQYLGHNYYTDIITFDYTENETINGDIFISVDTVRSNAEELGIAFDDELNRIMIHGILHLCGFKDKNPVDKAEMTRQEDAALEKLRVNCY